MKLVIDISEDAYTRLKDNEYIIRDIVKRFGGTASTKASLSILDGTPYEERPKGKWIEEHSDTGALGIKYTWFKCSKCGWDSSLVIPRNFCPACGADMRGD